MKNHYVHSLKVNFTLKKFDPIDPIDPIDPTEVEIVEIDCQAFPGICAVELEILDPTGDSLIFGSSDDDDNGGGGTTPPDDDKPDEISEECWKQIQSDGECFVLDDVDESHITTERCEDKGYGLECTMQEQFLLEDEDGEYNILFAVETTWYDENPDEEKFDRKMSTWAGLDSPSDPDSTRQCQSCQPVVQSTNCNMSGGCHGTCSCIYP